MQIERMLIAQLHTSWELGNTLRILVIVELVTILMYTTTYISYFVPILLLSSMLIRAVEISRVGYKILESFLPKNQYTKRKLLNLDNCCRGELSKIEHHYIIVIK